MAINYEALLGANLRDVSVHYSEKDVILYALGVGFGSDPLDPRELPFVSECRGLQTIPTMASMLVPDTLIAESGCDTRGLLHRTQTLELFRPLPSSGKMYVNQSVESIGDRGLDKGADIEFVSELRLARDDTPICVLKSCVILRSDGGFGGPPPAARSRHRLPDREPDLVCDLPTRPDQALLFRLTGDMNPLHVDPVAAKECGFSRPILHGRCTYGIACHAILKTVCEYDFTLIAGIDVRFSSPVYPGDVITTEMWQERNVVSFRCHVRERNVTVINDGRCTLVA